MLVVLNLVLLATAMLQNANANQQVYMSIIYFTVRLRQLVARHYDCFMEVVSKSTIAILSYEYLLQ